jgi:FKBP-type peptidyl-prolyl cis-trans isomerase FkpA
MLTVRIQQSKGCSTARHNHAFPILPRYYVKSLSSSSLVCAVFLSVCAVSTAWAQSAPVTTPSGLVYQSLKEGTGASPAATDVVKVHYRGTFLDSGKEFDSSYSRGEPTEFPLNGVIPCWTEGVQKMKVGGKAKLTCPPAIAYGERGAGGVIPPNATLHFDVELLGIAGR